MRQTVLTADCERCCALCCIAPPFSASQDFAFDKAAQVKCLNMAEDFHCTIHSDLKVRGFQGCVAYECYGAGQKVTQTTFKGVTWRDKPDIAVVMFDVFMSMRVIHELMMYLTEALKLEVAQSLSVEIQHKLDELERLGLQDAEDLRILDVSSHKREVDVLLQRIGKLVRA